MKQLNALCLISCVVLLNGCNPIKEAPPIIENQVPDGLLTCDAEPAKPSFKTGNNKRDFQNITNYTIEIKDAGQDCRSKIKRIQGLIKTAESSSP